MAELRGFGMEAGVEVMEKLIPQFRFIDQCVFRGVYAI